jgi:hypothetical protein
LELPVYAQVDIYEDKDNARRDEIASLGGQGGGQNVFTAFYDRFKEIREYHRRHPSAQVLDTGDDPEELLKEEPYIDFSGEVLSLSLSLPLRNPACLIRSPAISICIEHRWL